MSTVPPTPENFSNNEPHVPSHTAENSQSTKPQAPKSRRTLWLLLSLVLIVGLALVGQQALKQFRPQQSAVPLLAPKGSDEKQPDKAAADTSQAGLGQSQPSSASSQPAANAAEPSTGPAATPAEASQASKPSTPSEEPTASTESPYKAPNAYFRDVKGEFHQLADYEGETIVINFWASWCPPCRAEMPELAEFAKRAEKEEGLRFISINVADGVRETEKKALDYMAENNFDFPLFFDAAPEGAHSAGEVFQVISLPQTWIITPSYELYLRFPGQISLQELEARVEEAKRYTPKAKG